MSKISDLSDGGVIQGGDTLIAVRSGGNVKVTYGGSTTANIDGGTIDGTIIGGTTPAAGNFTTGSFTGNVSFGDNDKAIFGTGSDLNIYHNPSVGSIIEDTGAGALFLRGSNSVQIETTAGVDMLLASEGGAVTAYHNGSAKLATTNTGVDVTGSISADGLTLANATYIKQNDSASGQTRVLGFNASNDMYMGPIDSYAGGAIFYGVSSGVSSQVLYTDAKQRLRISSGGDISFYEDTGTTAKLTWDASDESLSLNKTASGVTKALKLYNNTAGANNRVGIDFHTANTLYGTIEAGYGAASPEMNFKVGGGTPSQILKLNSTGIDVSGTVSADGLTVGDNEFFLAGAGGDLKIGHDGTDNIIRSQGPSLYIDANNHIFRGYSPYTEHMRIDSSGNVGVGTSSPDTMLHLSDTLGGAVLRLERNDTAIVATDQYGAIEFEGQDANAGASGVRASMRAIAEASVGQTSLTFSTAGSGASEAERMRIDSSGNVGIGTDSPQSSQKLHIANTSGNCEMTLQSSDSGVASLLFGDATDFSRGKVTYDNSSDSMAFQVNNLQEAMRISSAGNVSIGTTSTGGNSALTLSSGSFSIGIKHFANNGQTSNSFEVSGSLVGSITHTTTSTAYNTSSDQRLKENIVDAPSASDDIDAIQVRSFDWKADGSHQKYGMVAQELNTVAPEAVSGDADSEEMMGVDYSKLVPMLVKEIQSLRARVAQLETN